MGCGFAEKNDVQRTKTWLLIQYGKKIYGLNCTTFDLELQYYGASFFDKYLYIDGKNAIIGIAYFYPKIRHKTN